MLRTCWERGQRLHGVVKISHVFEELRVTEVCLQPGVKNWARTFSDQTQYKTQLMLLAQLRRQLLLPRLLMLLLPRGRCPNLPGWLPHTNEHVSRQQPRGDKLLILDSDVSDLEAWVPSCDVARGLSLANQKRNSTVTLCTECSTHKKLAASAL